MREEPVPRDDPRDERRDGLIARLLADGVLRRDGARLRTARRWQSAMARAALHLMRAGDRGDDLRVPIVHALLELYPGTSDDELVALVALIGPIEAAELGPSLTP
jgi:hypothetical protein